MNKSPLGPEGRGETLLDLKYGRYRTVMNVICRYDWAGMDTGLISESRDHPMWSGRRPPARGSTSGDQVAIGRWVSRRASPYRRPGMCRSDTGRGEAFTPALGQKRTLRATGAPDGGQAPFVRETRSGAREASSGGGSGGRSCLINRRTVDFGKFITFPMSFIDFPISSNSFIFAILSSFS